ncbi:MAG: hypothetical protein OXU51_25130 [Candidatus Poribacteria bacterium]|nr:hypothetical protein [Candidatus Poribacteria bacterium]
MIRIFRNQRGRFFLVLIVVCIPISLFLSQRELKRQDRIRSERVNAQIKQEEKAAARAEYLRRKSIAEANGTQQVSAPVDGIPPSISEMTTDTTGATEDRALTHLENATDAGAARYTDGPYKGMTYEEAIKLWNKRDRDHGARMIEHGKKRSALTDVLLDSSRAERSVMLSLFADLNPEQLAYARDVALQTMPAEKVNVLLNAIKKIGEVKSLDQLPQEAEDILLSREAWEIADRELQVEWIGIKEEGKELRRTKPTPP